MAFPAASHCHTCSLLRCAKGCTHTYKKRMQGVSES
jgi:hypothetical protein